MLSLVSRVSGTALRLRAAASARPRLPAALLDGHRSAAAATGLGACVGAGLAAALHDARPQCAAVPGVAPVEDGSVHLDQVEKGYTEAADAGVDAPLTRESEARVIPLLARIGKLFAIKKAALKQA